MEESKPNGAVTLTPEEIEGLEGLRALVAELNKLNLIHPWLVARNGEMTWVQVAARINTTVSTLVESAVAESTEALAAKVTDAAIWLIHLAGYLKLDLVAAINERVEAVKQEAPLDARTEGVARA